MKVASPVLVLFAGLLVSAAGEDISGTWNMAPKPCSTLTLTVYEPTFEFKVDGGKLTGTARNDGWPGDGTVSDGKVEGNRITFTLTHEGTYTTNAGTFYATYRCVGTVHGDELDLTMVSPNPGLAALDMKGARVRE
ncbi:MAG TPA: hypothetical protein VGG72_33355 [Bryobacteraceae bacterium]|jgi:hypothetical protein